MSLRASKSYNQAPFSIPRLSSVSPVSWGPYVTDKSFEGAENHLRWLECYGARLICPPKRNACQVWPKRLRRWVASIRQIVESVYDKLFNAFGLWRERPHELEGRSAQFLDVAQQATRSPPAILC